MLPSGRGYAEVKWHSRTWLLAGAVLIAAAGATAQSNTGQSALALEQQGRNAEAESAWLAIAKADPHNAEAFAHLGLVESRQERYGEAIANYRHALELNPALPGLQMNLGLALFKSKDFKGSIKPFTAELQKHPRRPAADHPAGHGPLRHGRLLRRHPLPQAGC